MKEGEENTGFTRFFICRNMAAESAAKVVECGRGIAVFIKSAARKEGDKGKRDEKKDRRKKNPPRKKIEPEPTSPLWNKRIDINMPPYNFY